MWRQAFVTSSQTLFDITCKLISSAVVNKKYMYGHGLISNPRDGSAVAFQSTEEVDYEILDPLQHDTDWKQLCGSGEQF